MGAHIRSWTTASGKNHHQVRWSYYTKNQEGQAVRVDGKRTFHDKAEAKVFRNDKEAEISGTGRAASAKTGKETVAVWAERWYQSRLNSRKPGTLKHNRQVLDLTVIRLLGHRAIRTITPADVDDFILTVTNERKRSSKTVRHHYGVLRQVLKYAHRRGAIPANPAVGAEIPADRHDRPLFKPTALTEDQVQALAGAMRKHAPGTPYPLLMEFMAYTGLRTSEVAGLTIRDVRLLAGTIDVERTRQKRKCTAEPGECQDDATCCWTITTPKNKKPRSVPILTEWLQDDLTAYVAGHPHRDNPDAPLFPGRKVRDTERFKGNKGGIDYDRAWWRDGFYQRQFKPAVELAGLPTRLRLHDLRHTAGSIMLAKGIPPYRVAQYMGHSLAILLDIYASVLEPDVAEDKKRFGSSRPSPTRSVGVVTPIRREVR